MHLDDPNTPPHRHDEKRRNLRVDALTGLAVPVSRTLGWDEAEVTGGGLALDEVDPRTMAVRRHPGLYVAGELLDLADPIGGLNLQTASATAELAARDLGRGLAGSGDLGRGPRRFAPQWRAARRPGTDGSLAPGRSSGGRAGRFTNHGRAVVREVSRDSRHPILEVPCGTGSSW